MNLEKIGRYITLGVILLSLVLFLFVMMIFNYVMAHMDSIMRAYMS